jgi:hypothetical protein
MAEIKLDSHFAGDPFVIALGKKNAAFLLMRNFLTALAKQKSRRRWIAKLSYEIRTRVVVPYTSC